MHACVLRACARVCMCVCTGRERERDRDRDSETETETDRERQRQSALLVLQMDLCCARAIHYYVLQDSRMILPVEQSSFF